MQIIKAEVTPVELKLKQAVQITGLTRVESVTAIFVRLITRQGQSGWGCTIAHPSLTGELPSKVVDICRECAAKTPDLNPMNIEYSLAELSALTRGLPSVLCAFDLAFHDLLCQAACMPLYRLLGGFRNRILTSITIPISALEESVEIAREFASKGFRVFNIKGGLDPDLDVRRVQAIHTALPDHTLRLDADGGYTVRQAIDVAKALSSQIEMLEQPTPAADLESLRQVSRLSPIPILADQSADSLASALKIAAGHNAHGLSVKLVSCGGLRCARQIDAIARAAQISTMVSCLIEPALLIAGGLSLSLSSPNVRYGDLDGHLFLIDDPSQPGFRLEDGWLVASDVPGLGYSVNLG